MGIFGSAVKDLLNVVVETAIVSPMACVTINSVRVETATIGVPMHQAQGAVAMLPCIVESLGVIGYLGASFGFVIFVSTKNAALRWIPLSLW